MLHHPTGTDDYRRGIFDIYIYIYIYDSLQLGCVPVLLPQQRVPMDFMLGGILRRANLKLDDVFYFLVRGDAAQPGCRPLAVAYPALAQCWRLTCWP